MAILASTIRPQLTGHTHGKLNMENYDGKKMSNFLASEGTAV